MVLKVQKVKFNSHDTKSIYYEAFPKEERMPFWMMVGMSKFWNTQFLSFYDNDRLCGFVYMASNKKLAFIMFFAVDKELRSKGYGSKILDKIQKMNPKKKLIITIERCDVDSADIELRKRRKNFYLRNGYKETGYLIKLAGVEQEIIIMNGDFSKKEFIAFFALYSNGTMWPKIWKYSDCNQIFKYR